MAAPEQIPPAWTRDYVGLPFLLHGRTREGLDCWGLCALVLRERFGLDVPAYGVRYAAHERDLTSMATFIETSSRDWQRVEAGEPGDVVRLKIRNRPCHVGVMVTRDWFLHVHEGVNAVMERLDGHYWRRDRHVAGFFRWEGAVLENDHAV